VLLRREGESKWREPEVTAYSDEAAFRDLIWKSPDLLPGCDGSEAVATELVVPRAGRIDVVCIGGDGTVTVVECKLKSNPEIRRGIVGQVLAYAADLWGLGYEEFDAAFRARGRRSIADVLASTHDELDEESLRAAVAATLEDGRFRLVLAVDEITDEPKRIVRFLNACTVNTVEVLALELGYVASDGIEMLVPATYGEESAGDKSRRAGHWSEREFVEVVARSSSPEGLTAVKRLLRFARDRGGRMFPAQRTSAQPSMSIWLGEEPGPFAVFSIYAAPSATNVAINFDWMRPYTTEATLSRLAERVRAIPGAAVRLSDLEQREFRRRPAFPVDEVLNSQEAVSALVGALAEVLDHGEAPPAPAPDQ
jgi:hypothetical protein